MKNDIKKLIESNEILIEKLKSTKNWKNVSFYKDVSKFVNLCEEFCQKYKISYYDDNLLSLIDYFVSNSFYNDDIQLIDIKRNEFAKYKIEILKDVSKCIECIFKIDNLLNCKNYEIQICDYVLNDNDIFASRFNVCDMRDFVLYYDVKNIIDDNMRDFFDEYFDFDDNEKCFSKNDLFDMFKNAKNVHDDKY